MEVDMLLHIIFPYMKIIEEGISEVIRVVLSRVHYEVASIAIAGLMILIATLVSLKTGVSSAIFEIILGALLTSLQFNVTESLHVLSSIGVVLLMFMAGAEIDVRLLRKHGLKCLLIGTLSFTAPMLTIMTILHHLMGYNLIQSILIGTALSTTSVAIIYSFIDQAELKNSNLGTIMITSAMIADVLSMITLTVVFIGATIATLLYLLIMIAMIYLSKIFKQTRGIRYEYKLRLIIMVLIILAILSEFMGIHAILTAFIFGIFTSEIFHENKILEAKVKGLALGFLTPFFFLTAGTHINLVKAVNSIETTLTFTILSLTLKYTSTAIPLRLLTKIKDMKIPAIFSARLTLSTIAAITGLKQSIIGTETYTAILISSLLATILVGLILNKNITNQTTISTRKDATLE